MTLDYVVAALGIIVCLVTLYNVIKDKNGVFK